MSYEKNNTKTNKPLNNYNKSIDQQSSCYGNTPIPINSSAYMNMMQQGSYGGMNQILQPGQAYLIIPLGNPMQGMYGGLENLALNSDPKYGGMPNIAPGYAPEKSKSYNGSRVPVKKYDETPLKNVA